jgi:hypothetical protein
MFGLGNAERLTLASMFFFVAAAEARAETYSDPIRHYTVELPAGWQVMPADELNQVNAAVREMSLPLTVVFDAGFRPAGRPVGSYPYVLVQMNRTPTTGATYEDIESAFSQQAKGAVQKVEGKLTDWAKDIAVGSIALDRTRNRVVFPVEMELANVGKIRGLCVGHIGSHGIVSLNAYDHESEFERSVPIFQQLNESFRYDGGYEFHPASGSALSRRLTGPAKTALIGAVAGGIVGLVGYLLRKKRPQEPPTATDRDQPGR